MVAVEWAAFFINFADLHFPKTPSVAHTLWFADGRARLARNNAVI
jgi:hypothetical protein